jgi:GAF domain-containing protein
MKPEEPGQAGRQPRRVRPDLTFPDLPRLELDQLLTQLVERAQEVIGTQGRLRGLLQANQLIVAELDLPTVLLHVAQAARDLIGARYTALGVIGPTGDLEQFVHVGMPDQTVERIGHLPLGKGLLGALIKDPQPIRLEQIGDDPRSSGLPDGHPPMGSFLGVPISVRGEVFGNLYLTESLKGSFSREDEELAQALAATAAVAIENARLYESARTRGEWLQASSAVTRRLLSIDSEDVAPLRLIAERTAEVAEADLVVVTLPGPDGASLIVEVAVGSQAPEVTGRVVPMQGTLSGHVFITGEPLRVADCEDVGLTLVGADLDVGPSIAVPLLGSAGVTGVLAAFRIRGRSAFTAENLESAGGFANQAALAIELAEARAEQQRAAMLDERARIAADLHDHVIQRLFGAGLSLQAIAARIGPGATTDRVVAVIDELDKSIAQIRTTIFQLQQSQQNPIVSVRGRLLDVVSDAAPALGFEPGLRFSGLLDTLRGDVVDDLIAVVHEGLSNVARHARARSVEIEVTVSAGKLTLDIADDGVGIISNHVGSGLASFRLRADHHDGTVTFSPRVPTGTSLCWSVVV